MKKIWLTAAAMVFLTVTAVYGYFSDSVTVHNHISLGDVNIGLKEYEKKGSTEILYRNPKKIVPGDSISKIPRITNYAQPCWVRARIVMENNRNQMDGIQEEMLVGISSKWVRRGEYYYYTKALKKRESVDLFHSVKIPESWTEEHNGQELGMVIQAEAIQKANFTPDFSGMSPWGNQEIELCVHEKEGAPVCRMPETDLSVEFNGKAHKLLAVPGDFFSNAETLMPGDVFEDTAEISNTTDKSAEVFFRTEVTNQDKNNMELLKGINLKISMNGKRIYQGSLDSPELKKNVSLGSYAPEESGKLRFSLSVPGEWKNSYALRKGAVKWIFTVNEGEETTQRNDSGQKGNQTYSGYPVRPETVKTGDEMEPECFLIILSCTGFFIFAVFLGRKGGHSR